MDFDKLRYQLGLTLIDGIGDINAKALLAYCGDAEGVFKQKKAQLLKVPGIGEVHAKSIYESKHVLKKADEEIQFIDRYKIKPLFFTDADYPSRLKYCNDSPIMLYYKGNADLNAERIVAVVGSRKPSDYGRVMAEELIKGLKSYGVLVLSGLAYGIDVTAHKTALDNKLETVAVLAHGLDRIYPQTHGAIAKKMLEQGGLLTDFMSGTNPDAVNFPKRNRIVAGMCDALVVVESKRQGGSLITATIANSYNKDVFAFPGKAGDSLAEGCNGLIKHNKASLIENTEDLIYAMQWEPDKKTKQTKNQLQLQVSITEDEKRIIDVFLTKDKIHIDELSYKTNFSISKLAGLLLQMEFNNIIRSRPGKVYERA